MGLKWFEQYCSNCAGKTKHHLCDVYEKTFEEGSYIIEVYQCEFCFAKFELMERIK